MVDSQHCIRLYQTIKTENKIYMIQEYANCFDLQTLLEQRKTLKQEEARLIIRQIAKGLRDIQKKEIIHRDLKPANILLHFPFVPKLDQISPQAKRQFLKKVNLTKKQFEVKISDFGFSRVLNNTVSELSVVGTPLYSSPQLLSESWYDESVDTWALGCILYELVNGVTPFHSPNRKGLLRKIKDGRFIMAPRGEQVCIETCLFLLECLQMHPDDRLKLGNLLNSPLISNEYARIRLHELSMSSLENDPYSSELLEQ